MELQGQEGDEMAIPLNSTYGGGSHPHPHHPHPHAHAHGHIIRHDPTIIPASSAAPVTAVSTTIQIPSNGPAISDDEDEHDHDHHHHHHHHSLAVTPFKKPVRYRECLKNHAAAMGGNATDGCGEFMPSGEEGTLEALTCSACSCHRNFHRKEVEGEPNSSCEITANCYHGNVVNPRMARKIFMGHHHKAPPFMAPHEAIGYHHAAGMISSRPHQMIMSYGVGGGGPPSESDDHEDVGGGMLARPPQNKKRFRTKFTQEQKDKMLSFAEKVGWKIQKQEESVVQQFCQEIGVKRRVLKVWMHNNKHNLGKKSLEPNTQGESQV